MFTKPYTTNFNSKYGSNRWIVWSYKINRSVFLYSSLEYDHWLIIENNPLIKHYCEQPLLIETVNDNNKRITSIPDMYLCYTNGSEEIVEIKYKQDLETDRVRKQLKVQKEWCKKNNLKHQLLTEEEIRKNPIYLSNLKILSKIDTSKNLKAIEKIQSKISTERRRILSIAQELDLEMELVTIIIFRLIKDNVICSNIYEINLGFNTEVWIDG
ncbi:TnsA endonuclease N-terminal domain-containing protein [Planococcus soli]|uniref:TnsA endonuclease N-terminal domain-containing protein n=1 Tax=Planococcus soli TaxID=2666072 RepID=UPI00115F25DB|nr:TnsA endonuclease N-terminal domain-containing protein [Planococcus soli]